MWQIIGIILTVIFIGGLLAFIAWAFNDWMKSRQENAELLGKNAEMNKQGYAMTMNLEALRDRAVAEGHLEGVRRFFEEHATASADARYLPKIQEQNSLLLLQARNAEEEAGRAQRLRGHAADAAERQKAAADQASQKAWELQKQVKLLKAEKEAKAEIEQTYKDRQTPIRPMMQRVPNEAPTKLPRSSREAPSKLPTKLRRSSHEAPGASRELQTPEIMAISFAPQHRKQNEYVYSPYYLDRRGSTNIVDVFSREFENPESLGEFDLVTLEKGVVLEISLKIRVLLCKLPDCNTIILPRVPHAQFCCREHTRKFEKLTNRQAFS